MFKKKELGPLEPATPVRYDGAVDFARGLTGVVVQQTAPDRYSVALVESPIHPLVALNNVSRRSLTVISELGEFDERLSA